MIFEKQEKFHYQIGKNRFSDVQLGIKILRLLRFLQYFCICSKDVLRIIKKLLTFNRDKCVIGDQT